MALYDSEAHFVTPSGEMLVGAESIRKVVGGMIKARTQMQSRERMLEYGRKYREARKAQKKLLATSI